MTPSCADSILKERPIMNTSEKIGPEIMPRMELKMDPALAVPVHRNRIGWIPKGLWLWCGLLGALPLGLAHGLHESGNALTMAQYDSSVRPPGIGSPSPRASTLWARADISSEPAKTPSPGGRDRSSLAALFAPFSPRVNVRQETRFLFVESDGMPNHRMMVGITAWQQQVPLPQPYRGLNAWRIPLDPVPALNPLSAKTHFFRGAIAVAANGVPIFNPIKNDGRTDTFLAGELDEYGGHCGRADDYHYHIAPTHLQSQVGAGKPIAVALDGYLIYGFTEPDGSPVMALDAFNGHTTAALGYHYHATRKYPYLNGGFHGEVQEAGGQVDPQPRAQPIRPDRPPLPGARITGFTSQDNSRFSLEYMIGREKRSVVYRLKEDGSVSFDFVDGSGQVTTETYPARSQGDRPDRSLQRPGGADGPSRRPGRRGPPTRDERPRGEGGGAGPGASGGGSTTPVEFKARSSGQLVLRSPVVADGASLPVEFTGAGEGATLPLEWSGAPQATRSFALVMDHLARGPEMKCYWNVWDIPAEVSRLSKNAQGVGKKGATWKRGEVYVSPHSQGGGPKTYTLHLYALSKTPEFSLPDQEVTREMLLTAIQDTVLDSAELHVVYTPTTVDPLEGKGNRK